MYRNTTSYGSLARWTVLLFMGAAICITSARAATIQGSARSSQGSLLENIVVTAWGPTGRVQASATTDDNGFYVMPVPSGTYRLLAYDPQGTWATAFDGNAESFDTTPALTVSGNKVVTRDFVMLRAGKIRGAVRAGSLAKSGITIAAYNLSGTLRGTTTSGSDGAYSIVLPPGDFKLAAWDNGQVLATIFYPSTPSFDDATILTVSSGGTLSSRDFSMAPFARLSGTITDEETDLPLAGVTAYVYTPGGGAVASATSSFDGTFAIEVPGGTYRLLAADPGGVYAVAYYGEATTFLETPEVSADPGENVDGLDVAMPIGGQVSGRVRTGGGAALPGAQVAGYNPDGTPRAEATVGADGTYRLVLPPGVFRIAAFDPDHDYAAQFYDATPVFRVASPIQVDAEVLVASVDFALPRAGKVSGTVRDAETRAPLEGIQIVAWDDQGDQIASATSDDAGEYTIAVGPGSYRITAYDPGFHYANGFDGGASDFESTHQRSVSAGVNQVANFDLLPGILLVGHCVTPNGHRVRGIEVTALDLDGFHVAQSVSAGDGSFRLPLAPGNYKLLAHDPMDRFRDAFFDHAEDLAGATVIDVEIGTPPAAVALTVGPPVRRRHGIRRP